VLLHTCREFVAFDAGVEARVAGSRFGVLLVDVAEQFQRLESASGVTKWVFAEGLRSGIGGVPEALRIGLDAARAGSPTRSSLLVIRQSANVRQTTNVGRLSLSRPRPYDSHAPMHGKPGRMNPVFIM